jgi:hypothetical protein
VAVKDIVPVPGGRLEDTLAAVRGRVWGGQRGARELP